MHRCVASHLNGVNTIDPSEIRCRVFVKVVEVRLSESCYEKLFLCVSHSLYNELFVVTKEEEASTRTTCLPSFENIASVHSRTQGCDNLLFQNSVLCSKFCKAVNKISFNLHVFLNN